MFDVAVIGAGPAGSLFAKRLGSHLKVALIDKKSEEPDSFQKPCGGLLAPDAQKALASLGLNLPKSVMVDPQIFSVRTVDLDSALTRNYQRMYINLDRHKFDLWLMSQIPESVEKHFGCTVTSIEKTIAGYRVHYIENGMQESLEARTIVGADGAKSIVRHYLYPKAKYRSYLSIQQWFSESNPKPFCSCVFDSENTDCYSWSVSKDGYFIFGGAYETKNAREAFERQKKKLSAHGFVFGEAVRTEACTVMRPKSLSSFYCGKNNAFLIGEAAGFVSPSSLEGISSAIISAVRLSEIFNSGFGNKERAYRRATAKLRMKLWLKLLKCPFMYNRLLRKIVLRLGIKSIEVE